MEKYEIIKNIAKRSGGDIYLGVVGAVRTGKSTFIKRVVETLIVPNIEDEYERKRALDEIPQSAAGKTIMTTEPKFVPNNTAKIKIDDINCNIKLIDCVGYMINNAIGATDENGPRMVKTPWYNEEIPFTEAAEIGTEKVIKEHSTIGIVVTSDGSIGDFQRSDYIEAETRVIEELKSIGKPFIVVLNTTHPTHPDTENIAREIKSKQNIPVLPINIEAMNEKDMYNILREALYEFPVLEVRVNMPEWISILNPDNKIKKAYIESIKESVIEINKIRDVEKITEHFLENEYIEKCYLSDIDTSTGIITVNLTAPIKLYNETLNELIDKDIKTKADLLSLFQEYNVAKREYNQIKYALNMVKQTGYGIATPSIDDMKLDKPEIIKQGPRYGVKLKAVAPSIHMIKVDVESTFEPIIGSETQCKELIDYLTKDKETDKNEIWKSEIFGRSLDSIVQEGIQSKINLMPDNIRFKLQNTLTRVVNKGSNNVITIVI
ncbi:MAG: stage IV sporulation protein A [Mollicutes bacterium]|nr:stage IV sporulation protein A [Mollicutes bacterium]MDY5874909.1 stage IV sporulation protein A [Bacilli bacterium]